MFNKVCAKLKAKKGKPRIDREDVPAVHFPSNSPQNLFIQDKSLEFS